MRALQGMVIKRKRDLRRKQSGAGIHLCRSGGLRTQAADSPPGSPALRSEEMAFQRLPAESKFQAGSHSVAITVRSAQNRSSMRPPRKRNPSAKPKPKSCPS